MSELDLFAIGRCGDQVTRENLESNAISVHATTINHRIFVYVMAMAMLLLKLMTNDIHRNGIDKYASRKNADNTTNNQTIQTEHDHNDVRKNECNRRVDRMVMRFKMSTACRWAYQTCIRRTQVILKYFRQIVNTLLLLSGNPECNLWMANRKQNTHSHTHKTRTIPRCHSSITIWFSFFSLTLPAQYCSLLNWTTERSNIL